MNNKIFGYTWEQIQAAQQGGSLHAKVPIHSGKPTATEADIKLLKEHGLLYLELYKFDGVIDRLKNSGLI